MAWHVYYALLAAAAAAVLLYAFPLLLYVVSLLVAVVGGAVLAVLQPGRPYERRRNSTYPPSPEPKIEAPLSRVKTYPPPAVRPSLLSPAVDTHVQKVIDLTLEHHVISTYDVVGCNQEAFFKSVVPEVWNVLAVLLSRVGEIDTMKLFSQDMVEALRMHFEQFRGIHFRDPQTPPKFPNLAAFPYLESPEHELNFLRQVCEVLLCVSLPKELLACTPIRVLIREYLACRIFHPTIEMVCDPDYINQKLLAQLKKREESMNSAQKKYAYTTFEDFIRHIDRCEDVAELQQMRQFIITDIIQAKAVYKMRISRATGFQGSQFPIPIPVDKVKSLMERNLELYITQLGTAKTVCERQLRKFGGLEDYQTDGDTRSDEAHSSVPLGIPFETIMRNETTRMYFLQFLEVCEFSHLLCFWLLVDNLKASDPGKVTNKVVQNLHDQYLNNSSPSAVYADRSLVATVEEHLRSEKTIRDCLEALSKIQDSVYEELQSQFYLSFIASENYRELMAHNESGEGAFPSLGRETSSQSDSATVDDGQYKKKLTVLKTRLEENKIEMSVLPDTVRTSSLAQRKRSLLIKRSAIVEEIKKLEHYIEHTEEWFGTVGQWSVDVHSVDLSKEEQNDQNPLFIIVVHRPEMSRRKRITKASSLDSATTDLHFYESDSIAGSSDGTPSEYSEEGEGLPPSRAGWVVGRHLSEFQILHSKVSQVCDNLMFPSLPKKLPFQKVGAESIYWQKYRSSLQSYLLTVLKDDRLQESEDVFNFLSPASDSIRKQTPGGGAVGGASARPEKKKLHPFGMINVAGLRGIGMFGKDPDEPKEDSVAEYMYLLVSEIFELDEWGRVLRKQLVDLVQLTYGKSIDREVQESLHWVVSEPMLVFYLETFQAAMWPDGKPAPPSPTRSDEEKTLTKDEAKKRFLKSSPQALQTILGQRNCQIGFQKIFEALQDSRANKQLFYSSFEVLLYALIPELEKVDIEEPHTPYWRDQ